MSDTSTRNGKVVVSRSMSLDGFIAGPGHAINWTFDFMAPDAFFAVRSADTYNVTWRKPTTDT